jgi:shikimate dehydrogenase
MDINWRTQLYCLIGKPVSKSLSPIIHNNVFKELKEEKAYLAFPIEKENLKTTINGFKSMDIQGFNVTIPYKKEIIHYLDDLSKEAKIIGAVNTVKNENGKLIGYNTDGSGFIKTFYDNEIEVKSKNILLLGSGGAAYGIAMSLVEEKVNKIYISNRNLDNAKVLQNKINLVDKNILTKVGSLSLDNIDKKEIDIIINTTSIGMYPMEKVSPIELNGFSEDVIIYDIVYKPTDTKLIKDGLKKGYKTFRGMSMLLNQAILSQEIWLNKKIDLKIIKKIEGVLLTYIE